MVADVYGNGREQSLLRFATNIGFDLLPPTAVKAFPVVDDVRGSHGMVIEHSVVPQLIRVSVFLAKIRHHGNGQGHFIDIMTYMALQPDAPA